MSDERIEKTKSAVDAADHLPADKKAALSEALSKQPHSRYEPTVRVCTVFFSTVIGFALTRFFQPTSGLPAVNRWPCFTVALLLFSRFLFGSANHLWYELVRPKAAVPVRRFRLFWDLFCLVGLGVLAVFICDSGSVTEFLRRNLYFGYAGIAVAGVNSFRNSRWAIQWLLINAAHTASAGLGLWFSKLPPPFHGCFERYGLWVLVGIFFVLLCWDVHHQLRQIESDDKIEKGQ